MARSRLHSPLVSGALLLGASVAVGLVLGEIGLRIAGVSHPAFYDYDRITGSALHPGAEGWYRDEGTSYVTINSAGMHDREYALAKPADTLRIAVLGDSFTEALQVDAKDAFWSVLERRLATCPAYSGKAIEALNFGVAGYGTAQELLTYRHRARAYRPDIVLLAFFAGNDVRNNSKALEPDHDRPFFALTDGELVEDTSFLQTRRFALGQVAWTKRRNDLVNATRIGQLLARAVVLLRNGSPSAAAPADAGAPRGAPAAGTESGGVAAEPGIDDGVFVPPRTRAWSDAWDVTEALLHRLNAEARADGARLWIATVADDIQVHPDSARPQAMARRLGVASLDYPDRRIAALGARENIPVVTLLDPFKAAVDRAHAPLHGFDGRGSGHWNVAGHRLAGTIIADRICAAAR